MALVIVSLSIVGPIFLYVVRRGVGFKVGPGPPLPFDFADFMRWRTRRGPGESDEVSGLGLTFMPFEVATAAVAGGTFSDIELIDWSTAQGAANAIEAKGIRGTVGFFDKKNQDEIVRSIY